MKLRAHVSTLLLTTIASLTTAMTTHAQDRTPPRAEPRDVLSIDATVSANVQPDLAVITMAVEKQGADPAPLTNEVNQILARALSEAKQTAGVQASSGSYTTYPRYDNKGQRNGWVVHAEMILKAREFGTLGTLAGRLSKDLTIASNGFEISPELRSKEEATLIERGIAVFRNKAQTASKAFGNSGYSIREVTVGQIGGGMPPPRAMYAMQAKGADASAPMPVEPGTQQLSLTVSGSLQMTK